MQNTSIRYGREVLPSVLLISNHTSTARCPGVVAALRELCASSEIGEVNVIHAGVGREPAGIRDERVVREVRASSADVLVVLSLKDAVSDMSGMARAIAWSQASLREAGCDSVWLESVTVPHWTRGREWARCVGPVEFAMDMVSMGLSEGTGGEVLEAEVMAVRDWDEFEARRDEAAGKIVLFDQAMPDYDPDTYETWFVDGLNGPYTYSDMTGGQIAKVLCPQ